jgi:hypothetical protein
MISDETSSREAAVQRNKGDAALQHEFKEADRPSEGGRSTRGRALPT